MIQPTEFKFPLEEDVDEINFFHERTVLKQTLIGFFKTKFPQLPFPYKIFSKKNRQTKIFCYCRYCKRNRARII